MVTRIAGHMTTERFVPFWSEGEDSFLKDPPNAAVAFLEEKDRQDAVVVLRDPLLAGDDLTYSGEILEGEIPARAGAASLFNRCDRHAADAGLLRGGSAAHLAACCHPVSRSSFSRGLIRRSVGGSSGGEPQTAATMRINADETSR